MTLEDFDLPDDIYVDDVLAVQNLGVNVRVIFFTFKTGPGGVMVRQPTLCIVRPKSSFQTGRVAEQLRRQSDPRLMREGVKLDA